MFFSRTVTGWIPGALQVARWINYGPTALFGFGNFKRVTKQQWFESRNPTLQATTNAKNLNSLRLRNTRKRALNPFSSHADHHSALIGSDVPIRLSEWEQIYLNSHSRRGQKRGTRAGWHLRGRDSREGSWCDPAIIGSVRNERKQKSKFSEWIGHQHTRCSCEVRDVNVWTLRLEGKGCHTIYLARLK